MEAQSFVAIYAASDNDDEDLPEQKPTSTKAKSNGKGKGRTNAKRATKSKGKKKQAAAAAPRQSGRRSKVTAEEIEDDDGEEERTATAATAEVETEIFWLAELLDDVTEDMLDTDVGIHIRWLQKRTGAVYEYAFDDVVEVQTILCHVYMQERSDGAFELTPKSLARVERCVKRTRGEPLENEMEEDNEKPPPSRRKRRAVEIGNDDDGEGGGRSAKRRGGGGGGGGKGGKKLSKREEAMHIPPKYATVDVSKYEDTEIRGTHAFHALKEDTIAASKDVIRAVVTKNHKLLKKLTEDKSAIKTIYSFSVPHSADLQKTALHYAVEADDLTAAAMLLKARKLEKSALAKKPEMSLPSHSTGKHTSSYSDYNRRAINASRGGREGNNALVADGESLAEGTENDYLWEYNKTSVKMLTLFYPTGEWNSGYNVAYQIAKVCRAGNYQLACKLIETLQRNGGWGFNELHAKVLADSDEALPAFRSVSAIKQAYQTKVRPLHLAAINPNTKYLEALWDSVGDEWSSAKDDWAFEPIHYAAACESTAPLAFLLDRKCNLFARTKRRQTPIMRAIATGREANAVFIMEKALEQGDEILNKVVVERGPQSFQPIHYAAQRGATTVLAHLLKSGADINSVCEGKLTPLCLAARNGHYDCVQVLLDHGAKINLGDKLKKTPLVFAVKNGHTLIAALLINGGANVNAYDTSENSAVHYAASYGWTSCLKLLADAGADFWAKNSWGFVPLTCALLKQRLECSEFILERDPNHRFLDFRDRQGCTMLFLQCNHSTNASQIKYLLDKGLNPNIPNSDNVYPLQVLLERAEAAKPQEDASSDSEGDANPFYVDAIRLLLEHKALPHYDVDVKKPVPGLKDEPVPVMQPLQIAIRRNLKDVFLLLLNDYDADPTKQGSDGLDSWMTAVLWGRPGEFYLEALLQHHTTKHKTTKLGFTTRDPDGDNIFHCIGANRLDEIIDPALVADLIKKCANPTVLMNQKNDDGLTPLLKLLAHERDKPSKDISLREHADVLEEVKRADTRYSQFVELFAKYATTEETWIRYVEEHKAKTEVLAGNASTSTDATPQANDDAGSDDDSDANEEDEEQDDDDDDDDDDSDGDSEDDDQSPKIAMQSKTVPEASPQAAKTLVRFVSILHAAANRQLRPDAPKANNKWYGRNLVAVLLQHIRFDKATIDFADYRTGKTALDYAVQHGDVESVAPLLKAGADPNNSPVKCDTCTADKIPCTCPRDLVETALVVAVRNDNISIVRRLLDCGRVNMDCFEKGSRNRPLHLALVANSALITAALVQHKADLTKLNAAGSTALHLAVQACHSVIAKQPHEGEVAYTNLSASLAREESSLSAIAVALQSDQAKHVVMSADAKERTPVHLAAANRDLELLRALVNVSVNKKVCVNKGDQFGRTPLHFAVNASSMSPDASFEVERFLLQSGADANAADQFQFTSLHFALFKVRMDWHVQYDTNKDMAVAEREREAGTYEIKKHEAFLKVLATIPNRETDPVETVSNLTSIRGIASSTSDILGRTPLHLAAATGAFVCASAILSTQPNATEKQTALAVKDKDNFTPLGRAVEHLRQTTIMTLLQNGAHVDGQITVTEPVDGAASSDTVTRKTYSYFYHAVKNSLTGICHMLLNAKFSKRQAVEDAILCGQFQLASNLMVGIEVSSGLALLVTPNATGDTLLHSLARVDKPFDDLARQIAWSLVDAGLKANRTNASGCSPLHGAAKRGNIHLMDFLLHNKGDLNQRNDAGETPLVYALKRSKLEPNRMLQVVSYFVEKPTTDIHAKDADGGNLLSALLDRLVAAKSVPPKSFYEWIETLLKKGVDPNGLFSSTNRHNDFFHNDVFGSSTTTRIPPLIRAAYAGSATSRCNLLGLLLRFGAKVKTSDSNGNSLLMHLAAGNHIRELHLVMGITKTIRDPVDPKLKKMHTIHVPTSDVKAAVMQTNKKGQSVLHLAIQPLPFGSHENTALIDLLIANGASLQARDGAKRTPVDYTLDQASRFLYRHLRATYPTIVTRDEHEVFDDEMESWQVAPNFTSDAAAYIEACEKNGKIAKTRVHPEPNNNCDVGSLKRVFGHVDADDHVVSGEEYDALLTKVDVRNGRFGLNVFYRCQIVHDQIQDIYVVFTNWGRIGEEGKFQNTPFHAVDDAVTEFKKIFRSKTGNHWHERHDYVKHDGKYNLVQRANYHTKISDEITVPFVEAAEKTAFVASRRQFATSVSELLYAITDVRNLQLAASETAKFHGSLPLANTDELRAAVDRLVDIRSVIEARDALNTDMNKVRGDMSDGAATQLAELSKQHSDLTEEISEKSSRYYEVMPCNEDAFGSSIKAFDSVSDVNVEITRLRMLIDITHTYKMLLGAKLHQNTIHPLDYCYDALQVNLTPLSLASHEAKLLTTWFFTGLRTYQKSQYRISNVFQVARNGENTRFVETLEAAPSLKNAHAQLLWHGTKRTNLMGILSQGLRIAPPEAPHHGYLYGKGLYFANVASKSLAYCDAGYTITSTTTDADGHEKKKKRHVHYLLACQVALGSPKEVTAPVDYGKQVAQVEHVESVRAVGQHIPDPHGGIVSPLSGALLPLGKVGQVGVTFPYKTVWAKTEMTRSPYNWYDRNPTNTGPVQQLWATIIDAHAVGATYAVEKAEEQALFFTNTYTTRTITIEVVSKDPSANAGDASFYCDAVLKITVKPDSGEAFSWLVKRLWNASVSSPLGDDFRLIHPEGPEYDELIVYDEGQARIRYLVEVETL